MFIGIQFVLWTIGGLYFSWIALEDVHGDHLLKPQPRMTPTGAVAAPATVLSAIALKEPVDSLVSLDLASVAGRATYRIAYVTTRAGLAQTRKEVEEGQHPNAVSSATDD